MQGEVGDQASLNKVASQTKVVIATSGPYAKLGTPVVEACVSSGTHYCDITGKKGLARSAFHPSWLAPSLQPEQRLLFCACAPPCMPLTAHRQKCGTPSCSHADQAASAVPFIDYST